ncbi:MAG: ABC transporter ATP-binding protein [Beijerinckiaceae bacterium]
MTTLKQGAIPAIDHDAGTHGVALRDAKLGALAGPPALDKIRAAPSPVLPAIHAKGLVKEYHTNIGIRRVLDNISFEVRAGEKLAVLGRNGSGKSTLVKLLGGVEQPTSGEIKKDLFMSWPLGFSGGVEGGMTGSASARFIARLYGRDEKDIVAFVEDFAELGRQLYIPIESYSSGMRMRLMFALTLAIDFECFLIDEVIAVGDQRFHQKCYDALFVKRQHCAMILVSHDINIIKQFCNRALVLKSGRGKVFEDLDLALEIYATL